MKFFIGALLGIMIVNIYYTARLHDWTKVITAYSIATFEQTQCENMKDKLYWQCKRSKPYWEKYEKIREEYNKGWK